MEFLDQKLIGLFLAFVSATLPIVFYFLSRTNKRLDCKISNNTIIDITKKHPVDSKLVILYNKERISKLDLVNIKLYNTGNVPISSRDFETDIIINFNSSARTFEPRAIKNKYSINPEIIAHNNTISIKPFLLNKGESIEIQTIISGYIKNDISIDSRILGCKVKLKSSK